MASHISLIGNETRLAGKLRQLVDSATSLQDQSNRMKQYFDECGAGAGEWANVGAKFGISAVDAQIVYNLLLAAKAKVNSADVDNFVNRLG